MRPALKNTDEGSPADVLAAVKDCATSWEPGVRIIGDVRAGDIVRAIEAIERASDTPELFLVAYVDDTGPYAVAFTSYAKASAFASTIKTGARRVWDAPAKLSIITTTADSHEVKPVCELDMMGA